jgi:plasmid stabilization system protein ParE
MTRFGQSRVRAFSTHALRFAAVDKDRRRAGVRRFPYGFFFLVEATRIVVIACFHAKRHPTHWQRR